MHDKRADGKGWIGVDLDGTLAHWDHYRGDDHVGKPVEQMVKRVRQWIREGKDVRLFTARKPHPAIRRWMQEHLGKVLPITNTKDHFMQAFYDDRAVQVRRNTGETSDEDEAQVWQPKGK
jgi:16S rRNA C967 or C1407 C5-methylase (RsmB/RsmF family)